ncbi:outer membrane protein assembly factor BamB family protein [Lignipirellula cremea]|uniref:Pyrrolo-quinoline quinone repeat domain-containing protein n=1 Tax=Lignipirellula cremea TaxID=2528010 RepID=A0A518DXU1_9BACT|nr:PQQ-binding-like beta-propeller repeat protein [Lignipirellula cremea]QDU96660.1 hypothetical protein Pla8534_44810 [Lignipirellula cremea]
MNDAQLIAAVRDSAPEELTPGQLRVLQSRLVNSPSLRLALKEELENGYLATAFGRIDVSLDDLQQQIKQQERSSAVIPLAGMAAGVVLLLLAVLILRQTLYTTSSSDGDPRALAPPSETDPQQTGDKLASDGSDPAASPAATDPPEPAENQPADATSPAPEAMVLEFPFTLQAEAFDRGNVVVDNSSWGDAENQVLVSKTRPAFVEYDLQLPAEGDYEVRVRYAAFASRPLTLSINGQTLRGYIAGEQTGGNDLEHQRWFTLGKFPFREGKNVVRMETSGDFPHVDQLTLDPVNPIKPPAETTASTEPAPETSPAETPAEPAPGVEEPVDPAQPIILAGPWDALFKDDYQPPAWREAAFAPFQVLDDSPDEAQLKEWLAEVRGHKGQISETNVSIERRQAPIGAMEGVVRCRAPWTNDSVLRLELKPNHSSEAFQIHLFDQKEGITLAWYSKPAHCWAAYRTTRKIEDPMPSTYALTADDQRRSLRSNLHAGGAVEIRHRDGYILISRGDLVLLQVPFAGPIEETYFEGKAAFYRLEIGRTTDAPLPEPERPVTTTIDRPADLEWSQPEHEASVVERLDNGGIRFSAGGKANADWISARLPEGLHEVIVELENVSTGVGVFLGHEKGQPWEILRTVRNEPDDTTCLMLTDVDTGQRNFQTPDKVPTPCIDPGKTYLRLMFGGGILRWWMSTDGRSWAEGESQRFLPAHAQHLGLFHRRADDVDRHITLRSIRLRKLEAISSMVDPQLLAAAPGYVNTLQHGVWLGEVLATLPEGADREKWLTAAAINSLAIGPRREFAVGLFDHLLASQAYRALPPEKKVAVLDEITLLIETPYEDPSFHQHVARYQAALADADSPFTALRDALLRSPMNTLHNNTLRYCEAALRVELIQRLYNRPPVELLELCRDARFYHMESRLPLIEWAEAVAERHAPREADAGLLGRLQPEWRQPLVEELSKDAYNILAEMNGVLEGGAFDDAARQIAAIEGSVFMGLAPSGQDARLLVSLPAAVKLAMNTHPELREAMRKEFEEIAGLRVRRAIHAGDVDAVTLIAVQFEATTAAAEAHRWLGDRALSSGWFARALSEYQQALPNARAVEKGELRPRIRLAAAMLGREEGQPPVAPVQFGDIELNPEEFENLVAEMIRRESTASVPVVQSQPPAPAPTGFAAESRGEPQTPDGNNRTTEVVSHVKSQNVDWAGRQMAYAVEGDLMYASNRFQLNAYNLATGQTVWRGEQTPGKMLRAQDWAMIPMRPLILGDRIFARMLYNTNLTLCCFQKADGKLAWSAVLPANESLVSDPVVLLDRLLVLTVARNTETESMLKLTTFDRETGEVVEAVDLVRLRDSWWTKRACCVTPFEDSLVAVLGGAVLCCDERGGVRWIRRETVLPSPEKANWLAAEEATWVRQHYQSPLATPQGVVVSQPGVRLLECLDPETGELQWRRILPDLERVWGLAGERLIVQTTGELLSLDPATGLTQWRQAIAAPLEAIRCTADGPLMYFVLQPAADADGQFDPVAVWRNPADGALLARATVTGMRHKEPRLGPLISGKEKHYLFYSPGLNDQARQLYELKPAGEVEPPIESLTDFEQVWLNHLPGKLIHAAEKVAPGWKLVSANLADKHKGELIEFQGKKEVLELSTLTLIPTTFLRQVEIPADGSPRLKMEIGCPAGTELAIQVRANGEEFWKKIETEGPPDTWRQIEVDLKPLAGRSVLLEVTVARRAGSVALSLGWKRLEITY